MKKSIKVLCLLFFVTFGMVALVSSDRFVTTVESFPGGPPAGLTGAPGESTCIDCHSGNPGPGQFNIIAPPTYEPGQTYQIMVRHTTTDNSRRRWGFELTALSGIAAAGTFANLSSATQTLSEFNRFYIAHTLIGTFANQQGGSQWTFNWNAPATNVGTVVFYAAGNQANGDNTPDGDQIYTAIAEVPFGGATPTPTPTPIPTPTPTPTPTVTPTPTPTPTPSTANISGRVVTPDGRGLRSAIVTLSDPQGNSQRATTSSFGFYTFENILPGQSYFIGVSSKRYRFATRSLEVNGDLINIDFTGLE